MKSDRDQRIERWQTAVQWAAVAVAWVVLASVTPDLPLLTLSSENPYVAHLAFALAMAMFGYGYAWFVQWRELPDAPGPDDLDEMDWMK